MARKNEEVNQQQVADNEGQTAPVAANEGAQQPKQAKKQQPARAQEASGTTAVKFVGRGGRYADGEEEYERGVVYEVDEATANRLLSARGSNGQHQFVQAD